MSVWLQTPFTWAEMSEFTAVTFLSKAEIARLWAKFEPLAPDKLGFNRSYRVPFEIVKNHPDFMYNPFNDRICKIFSTGPPSGSLNFSDFLDIYSAFNTKSSFSTKVEYAYQVFGNKIASPDFDDDGEIGDEDIKETLKRLAGGQISDYRVSDICNALDAQVDLELKKGITYLEFKNAATKFLAFSSTFTIPP